MFRLFTGIKIIPQPDLLEIQSTLMKALPASRISWVKPENFHITVKFYGDVDLSGKDLLIEVLNKVASGCYVFELTSRQAGYFGPGRQPRVIWYGFDLPAALHQLYTQIELSSQKLGFQPEQRDFHPHLTLGRVKYMDEPDVLSKCLNKMNQTISGVYKIDCLYLFKSTLRQSGPVYETIGKFPLKDGKPGV